MTDLKQLRKQVEQAIKENTITPRDISKFVSALVKVITETKTELLKDSNDVTRETAQRVDKALETISDEYLKTIGEVETLTSNQKEEFKNTLETMQGMIAELQAIEMADGHTPEKGVDYFTPEDIADIVKQVCDSMGEDMDGVEIIQKINEAPLKEDSDENKIDYARLKNVPNIKGGRRGGKSYLSQLLDVAIPVDGLRNNDMLRWNSDLNAWEPSINLTVSDTEPSNPQEGDLWIDTA